MDVIESLYRDSGRRRSALRPFETALHPPEGADGYSWLYRAEPVVPAPSTAPAATTTLRSAAVVAPARGRHWPMAGLLAAGLICVALAGVLLAGSF